MIKKVVKIILIFGLIFIIFSSSVFAATGTVTGSTVRIREKASSNSQEVSAAKKGEKVEIIGEEGNWYHVKFEKITGYISKDYVDSDGSAIPVEQPTTIVEPEANTSEPATNQDQATTEPPVENTEATVTIDTSAPVTPSEDTTSADSQESSTENTATEETNYEKNQTVTFAKEASLRYLPNFSSRVSSTAANGESFTVIASLNKWVKVSNDTHNGWVLKNVIEGNNSVPTENTNTGETSVEVPENSSTGDVTSASSGNDQNPETEATKGKVNVDSARIRKSPNGEVLDSISKGTEVTILGEENDWYKIKTDKYDTCYIAKRLITEN